MISSISNKEWYIRSGSHSFFRDRSMHHKKRKIGVFIDLQNIYLGVRRSTCGDKVDYRKLKEFLGEMYPDDTVTLCAFTCHDPSNKAQGDFLNTLAMMGYRVVSKPIKRLPDGNIKANMDLEMAIEVFSQAPFLDEIVLVTGDGDFTVLVNQMCLMGKLVTVIGPDRSTAPELMQAAHTFISLSDINGIIVDREEF